MKNLNTILIFGVIILFTSCKKKASDENPYQNGVCSNNQKAIITINFEGNTYIFDEEDIDDFNITSSLGLNNTQISFGAKFDTIEFSFLFISNNRILEENTVSFPNSDLETAHLGVYGSSIAFYNAENGSFTFQNYKHDGIRNEHDTHYENYYSSGTYSASFESFYYPGTFKNITIDFCVYGDI